MNYQEIHDRIIFRAKIENRKKLKRDQPGYVYYEAHHILPKCIYPEYSNFTLNPWNKILLTGREHYVIHQLLIKIYPENHKLIKAVHKMTSKPKRQIGRSKNKLYEWIRRKHAASISVQNTGRIAWNKNKSWSEQVKRKLKDSSAKSSYIRKGRKQSASHIKNKSIALKGRESAVTKNNLKWYNNGSENIYIEEGTNTKEFIRGRIINWSRKKKIKSN